MKSKSLKWAFSIILALSIGISGCNSTPPAPPSIEPTNTPVIPTETSIPSVQPAETETIVATMTPTPFVPKATIRIVSENDTSSFGIALKQGVELAVNDLSADLNELGYQIDFVSYDDQGDVDLAIANSKEIIADPSVLCGVGPLYSFIFIQTAELYHRAGISFISPSATRSDVTKRGYPEVNRILGRGDFQGTAAAHFAFDKGMKSIFVISDNDSANLEIVSSFNKEAKKLGLNVADIVYTDKTESFDVILANMIAMEPDMVFSPSSSAIAGVFFREATAAGFEGLLLGSDNLDTSELGRFVGPLVLEGGGLFYINAVIRPDLYPGASQFIEDYKLKFADSPGLFSVQAYDAAGFCLKAIENAILAKNGELPTRDEVTRAIHSITEYQGISGTYTFNDKGDLTGANFHVMKVLSIEPENWNLNTLEATYLIPPNN